MLPPTMQMPHPLAYGKLPIDPALSPHIPYSQFKFIYYNHQLKFPTTTTQKLHKFKNLILHLQNLWWQTLPPIVITFSIHDTIHQPPIDLIFNLHILKPLMANLFANTVQYLAHIILNKVKLENNNHQSPSPNSPLPHLLFGPTCWKIGTILSPSYFSNRTG